MSRRSNQVLSPLDPADTRECLLFPTYAYRNPKDPSEWVIRTRGWALAHNRSNTKQKFVANLSKRVVGSNAGDIATFHDRFKYFLAKNKRNRQFSIRAIGIHADHIASPFRRDSDGSTDSGYQSSVATTTTTFTLNEDDLMERPLNPLSSILSGSRILSTPSLLSNDDTTSDTSTCVSSLITSHSYTTSRTSTTTMDGQAVFTTESSGFFAGSTLLTHQKVLEWAKEKDCCDARLIRLQSVHRPFPLATGLASLIEPTGISIISDIDDTIKETRILHGARTVLANTFFNSSKPVPGMAEAYMKWYTQGASFHYVSNSPFQLLPFLEQFLHTCNFPCGSMHLRLDGSLLARLIEVPGRAKRDAILAILHDFPHRQFVLVGDSGEIDLEIYTKIALEHPRQIIKIFIHNVTTPYAIHKKRVKKKGGSSSSLLEEEQKTTLLDIASSSVLGLARGRTTKSLIEQAYPPSQQCMQLYDRVQKARNQLEIDIVLFDTADTLRDDLAVQQALWQHWDNQSPL